MLHTQHLQVRRDSLDNKLYQLHNITDAARPNREPHTPSLAPSDRLTAVTPIIVHEQELQVISAVQQSTQVDEHPVEDVIHY
jgi:hypothetical protein